jgi:hypothetical protein
MTHKLDYASPASPFRRPFVLRLSSAGVTSALFLCSAAGCVVFGSGGLHAIFNPLPFIVAGVLGLFAATAIRAERGEPRGDPPCRHRLIAERLVFWSALTISLLALYGAATAVDPHIITRNRMYCQQHLLMVGQAIEIYADSHGGRFPDSLLTLANTTFKTEGLDINSLTCPEVQATGYWGPTAPAAVTAILNDLAAPTTYPFVYLGNGLARPCPSKTVLVHDRPSNHGTDGGPFDFHVLYADGSVASLSRRESKLLLAELQSGHNPPRAEKLR